MEIYKDEVYDLLVDRDTVTPSQCYLRLLSCLTLARFLQAVKLPVRENEHGQVFVANLSAVPVQTLQDFDAIFSYVSTLIPLDIDALTHVFAVVPTSSVPSARRT